MKIGIIGCNGRMGHALIREVVATKGVRLAAGLEQRGSPAIGKDLGQLIKDTETGVKASDNPVEVIRASDALINFTAPDATVKLAEQVAVQKKIHIIGTTGLSQKQQDTLRKLAKKSVIVQSHNMSVGINLLLNLVSSMATILPKEAFDIEVLEMHHRHKVDAPSGTALSLGEAAAAGRKVPLNRVARKSRDGNIGERKAGEIGFATLRGGSVIGEHSVIFAGNHERIELRHVAEDRGVFAHGAVRAALWARGRKAGLYTMQDVLGL